MRKSDNIGIFALTSVRSDTSHCVYSFLISAENNFICSHCSSVLPRCSKISSAYCSPLYLWLASVQCAPTDFVTNFALTKLNGPGLRRGRWGGVPGRVSSL